MFGIFQARHFLHLAVDEDDLHLGGFVEAVIDVDIAVDVGADICHIGTIVHGGPIIDDCRRPRVGVHDSYHIAFFGVPDHQAVGGLENIVRIYLCDAVRTFRFDGANFNFVLVYKNPFELIESTMAAGPGFGVVIGTEGSSPTAFTDVYGTRGIITNKAL